MTDPLIAAANAISTASPKVRQFAQLAAARIIALEQAQQPPAPTYLFDGDPNKAGNLTPWDNFDAGIGTSSVIAQPNGATYPGVVRVVDDPLGQRGKVYELTVTKDAHASPAVNTDSVYLWNVYHDYGGKWARPGTTNVLRWGTLFTDAFVPEPSTQGGVTWLCECHNGGPMPSPYSSVVFGIVTDHRLPDGSIQPQLVARYAGGNTATAGEPVYRFSNKPIPIKAWVDWEVSVIWDALAGFVSWSLTGGLTFTDHYSGPTLYTDGSQYDLPNFELVNYRPHMDSPSTVFFSRATIT